MKMKRRIPELARDGGYEFIKNAVLRVQQITTSFYLIWSFRSYKLNIAGSKYKRYLNDNN
ncbi:MAG: hypothetical protein SCARUB_01877 [Candidatus Scalindua rubra]|uniref:Uncharacterized protein n=1 Tax=Candidatus Scalindua rubra TaxID=1872076 RepID=A0A1E3XBM4_9BACT|nr:MAG: hypothetical protein SCARUB_01877 [Candidatus Scalindua rubra]